MDRFRELSAFVAVAEHGAFNAAARQLRLSPAAITRLVTGLEERLGVRLFARTTRKTSLTEAGRRLLDDAERILQDLEAAEALARGADTVPRGLLRITAPVLFGQRFIAPIVLDFLESQPEVVVEVVLLDRVADMIEEGFDVAVRIGPLPDSTLTATRVGAVRLVTAASPGYLERCGTPGRPEDLRHHDLIHAAGTGTPPEWVFAARGERRRVRFAPRFAITTMVGGIDAAMAGRGIVRGLSYQLTEAIETGSLVEILHRFEDREMPIHLVHAEGRRAAAKIRSFVQVASQTLRRDAVRLMVR